MDARWRAAAREAATASQHIASGVTALGRANYANLAYYSEAFFALSTGLERTAKLVLVAHHFAETGQMIPNGKLYKQYGHHIDRLVAFCRDISPERGRSCDSVIHTAIISTLSEFASNGNRYYNFDLLTTGTGPQSLGVEQTWIKEVTDQVLTKHYRERDRRRHAQQASYFREPSDAGLLIRAHLEDEAPVEDLYEASMRSQAIAFAKPWERMYILQIARFLAEVLDSVGARALRAGLPLPIFSDFYRVFLNPDNYLRQRATWSIYA